ncbi:ABC transporter substrate-binding protein [Streptomyces sp. NPDC058228]|uniref:ABC transporter substrate-binding protein n=1 Tax=unclassified Streptomyces TaxID=2593676 RepID=UPI0036E33BB9
MTKGWSEKVPVSGNTFKIGEYDRTAQTVTAVPDPKWWGNKPKLDSVIYRVLDFSAMTDAYLNKETDSATALLPEDHKRLGAAPGTEIRRGARWDEVHITLNGGRGPLKDVKVRNALQAAIDRKGVNTSFSKDLSFELKPLDNHFFMPNQVGYQANAGESSVTPSSSTSARRSSPSARTWRTTAPRAWPPSTTPRWAG